MEFLVEFDNLTAACGIHADSSKIAFLFEKLSPRVREQLVAGVDIVHNYSTARNRLGNIYSRDGVNKK
jgi:hypothetical protein